ncbi:MAG: serine hydrolase [Acidimicrobiales bacterium]
MPVSRQQLHDALGSWAVPNLSARWSSPRHADSFGHLDQVYPLASLTKPLVAMAVLVAVEEASLTLDDPVEIGPFVSDDGTSRVATVRQL